MVEIPKVMVPKSLTWSLEEEEMACQVLEKIKNFQDHLVRLPERVFEAHARSKKNVSTEMVAFNDLGQIYLIRRPSFEKNPNEPYPNQLHVPGATLKRSETLQTSIERLERRELRGVRCSKTHLVDCSEVYDEQRGGYILRIVLARTRSQSVNSRGKFYAISDIPWKELVSSHRDIILPKAIGEALKLGWIKFEHLFKQ